jgi:AraC-like DNA-binding protein
MEITVLHIAGFSAVFQSILVIAYNWYESGRKNVYDGVVLSVLLLLLSFLTLSIVVRMSLSWMNFYDIFYVLNQSAFFLGLILYIYVRLFLQLKKPFKSWMIVPLCISSVIVVYYTCRIMFPEIIPNIVSDKTLRVIETVYNSIFFGLSMITMIFMWMRSGDKSKRSSHVWLLCIFAGIFIAWFLRFLVFIAWDLYINYNIGITVLFGYYIFTFIIFNTIFFFALKRPDFFTGKRKYFNSGLTETDKTRYAMDVGDYMISNKPYLEPVITMKDLAEKMSIPHHHMSQVLNEVFNKNFFDFINGYRIEESKKIMRDDIRGDKTIIEILFAVGFNSKSTFNAAFKKHTGMTPKEFRRKTGVGYE